MSTKLAFLVLAGLGIIVALALVKQRQETRRGAYFGSIGVSVLPSEGEYQVGETLTAVVVLNAGNFRPTYLDFTLTYDPNLLELKKEDIELGDGFTTPLKKQVANGRVRVVTTVGTTKNEALKRGVIRPVKLPFKVLKAGQARIDFAQRNNNYQIEIAGYNPAGLEDVSLRPQPVSGASYRLVEGGGATEETTPTPTPTTPPEGWPVLNFRIRFKGTEYQANNQKVVVRDIPPQPVTVRVRRQETVYTYDKVMVTFDDQAVAQGRVELVGVTPGNKYAVIIKGPRHLARRFCRDQQEERCLLGQENLTLRAGENQFDWTALPLEPGDVNLDHRVDSLDFSRVRAALGQRGDEIAEDLNFNKVVNSQDLTLLLLTLGNKYEDE